jgi:hypothetical protein
MVDIRLADFDIANINQKIDKTNYIAEYFSADDDASAELLYMIKIGAI